MRERNVDRQMSWAVRSYHTQTWSALGGGGGGNVFCMGFCVVHGRNIEEVEEAKRPRRYTGGVGGCMMMRDVDPYHIRIIPHIFGELRDPIVASNRVQICEVAIFGTVDDCRGHGNRESALENPVRGTLYMSRQNSRLGGLVQAASGLGVNPFGPFFCHPDSPGTVYLMHILGNPNET